MSTKLVNRFNDILSKLENKIISEFFNKLTPGLCSVNLPSEKQTSTKSTPTIKDIWNEGILWGVPKHRRSLEKRLSRKFGWPEYNWKPLVPKTNLKACRACGHFHETFTICGHCYAKVRDETKEMQAIAEEANKLNPVKNAIVFMYEGESKSASQGFWKGQQILEVPKKRPSWFHQNLLEPLNEEESDVKKEDLKHFHEKN